jgi:hypothetical protein
MAKKPKKPLFKISGRDAQNHNDRCLIQGSKWVEQFDGWVCNKCLLRVPKDGYE